MIRGDPVTGGSLRPVPGDQAVTDPLPERHPIAARDIVSSRRAPVYFQRAMDTSDRRGFFRQTLGRALREVAERTEERVVTRRYVRPPGAIPEVGFLAA